MLDTTDTPPAAADFGARLRRLERENMHLRALVQRSAPRVEWRQCEFCGCNTNAAERLCCASGRRADRQSWDPTE